MEQILLITAIIFILKALVLWVISIFLRFKRNGLSPAFLVNFINAVIYFGVNRYLTVPLSQMNLSRGVWLLQLILPLILIKVVYKVKWLLAILPWLLLILIDPFIRKTIQNVVYHFFPLG